jgi:hypothetical protein
MHIGALIHVCAYTCTQRAGSTNLQICTHKNVHILQEPFHHKGVKLHDCVPSREAVKDGRSTILEIFRFPEAAAVNKHSHRK